MRPARARCCGWPRPGRRSARLVAATPAFDALPAPEVVVAAGGAWAVAPAPAVALALADVLRRPGVRALGWDHARLLAPLGTLDDEDERRQVMTDLRDDLLRAARERGHAGRAEGGPRRRATCPSRGVGGPAELDLVPGGLELVDLPPGERADGRARSSATRWTSGVRVKHAAVEVGGGLGGLLVDLRDVPLRLPGPARAPARPAAAWQAALWAGMEA